MEFIEWYPRGYGVAFKVKRKILEEQSEYQKLKFTRPKALESYSPSMEPFS